MSTDFEWQKWGLQDPYFSVLTDPKFRKGEITAEAKQEFFASGRVHVEHVLSACRKYVDPAFAPKRVLDFGCGVGRLVLPFAAVAREVVGVDISEAMLAEARRNCVERGALNVELYKSDDALTQLVGHFDLMHTAIVFQHIDTQRGTKIFRRLLEHIAPGGIGAVQLTYAKAYHPDTLGAPPPPTSTARPTSWWRAARPKPANIEAATTLASGGAEPGRDPEMQMNPYNLNQLLFLMQSAGVTEFHTDFTDHGGELGVFMYFRKP